MNLFLITPNEAPAFATYVVAESLDDAISLFRAWADRTKFEYRNVTKAVLVSRRVVVPPAPAQSPPGGPYR